jgi:hypothetical protein
MDVKQNKRKNDVFHLSIKEISQQRVKIKKKKK